MCFANAGGYIVQHCLVLIAALGGEEEIEQPEKLEIKKSKFALARAKAERIIEQASISIGLPTARSQFKLKKKRRPEASVTEQMVRFMIFGETPDGFPWLHRLRLSNEVGPVIAIQTPRARKPIETSRPLGRSTSWCPRRAM